MNIGKQIAYVFPGQGSQKLGMFSELSAQYPIIIDTFSQASAILGYDLWQLTQAGPEEKLNLTENTQPAMLAADVAAWRVCCSSKCEQPSYLAGHSLGEYSALVCAGAIDFADAIELVAKRGSLMQSAVPAGDGAMAAIIGLDNKSVNAVCNEASENAIVAPANYNSVGQTVIAGERAAVERAAVLAKQAGALKVMILPVSVPAHCNLMQAVAKQLADLLAGIEIVAPKIPVIHNVDVMPHKDPSSIRAMLVQQLYSPVRWVETIEFFAGMHIDEMIECGPGRVLAGLNKRITKEVPTINFSVKLSD